MENPKTRVGIANNLAKVKKKLGYQYQDIEKRKVWINFVTDRDFKEIFASFCKENGINQSEFFRKCCKRLIEERNDKWI